MFMTFIAINPKKMLKFLKIKENRVKLSFFSEETINQLIFQKSYNKRFDKNVNCIIRNLAKFVAKIKQK